jgi:GNAT superfamily N-acetyltransferase
MFSQQLGAGTTDFIDKDLSYRLESAEWLPSIDLVDTLARERPQVGAERRMVAGGWMIYAGPQSPLNHMIGMGLRKPVSSDEFDGVEEFYRTHKSVCEVVVSPYADMSVMRHLGDRGYRVTDWNSVLVRKLDPGEPFQTCSIEVRPVQSDDATFWSELVARAFSDIVVVSPDFFVPFATARNSICFLAYLDGKPAGGAGGSVFPEHGIAPLYGASTLPEFRNRGVHNALFQARMRAAVAAGCRLAVVCTQPGTVSQRNAERNGFRVAYTKVTMQRHL